MSRTTKQQIVRYGTVLLNGAKDDLTDFAVELRHAGYVVARPNANVLCVDDVSHEELFLIKSEAADRNCFVESVRGEKVHNIETTLKKAEYDLDVDVDRWYFAENLEDSFPFVLVRAKYTETLASEEDPFEEEERIILEMELLDENGSTPKKIKADLSRVVDFGLRPATEDDFDDRDLPVPMEVKLAPEPKEKKADAPIVAHLANFEL